MYEVTPLDNSEFAIVSTSTLYRYRLYFVLVDSMPNACFSGLIVVTLQHRESCKRFSS